MEAGTGRDTEILLKRRNLHGESSVLWGKRVGDIHFSEKLNPDKHGILNLLWKVHDISQMPMDTESQQATAFVGFKVDVTRALLERSDKHAIGKMDQFAGFYHLDELLPIHCAQVSPCAEDFKLFESAVEGKVGVIVQPDSLLNVLREGEDRANAVLKVAFQ